MLLGNAIFLPHSPVVCPNSKYRMIYLNMGHGDDCFSDAAQKQLFTNAFR